MLIAVCFVRYNFECYKSRLCFTYKLYIFKLNRMGSHKIYKKLVAKLVKTSFFPPPLNKFSDILCFCYIELCFIVCSKIYYF